MGIPKQYRPGNPKMLESLIGKGADLLQAPNLISQAPTCVYGCFQK